LPSEQSTPDSHTGGYQKTGVVALLAGILFYVVLQAFFFPSYHSTADEGCYASMAFVFARGRVSAEGLDLNVYRFWKIGDRLVGIHDHGYGWLLVPFTVFGWRALFAFNVLVHLIGFIVFYLLLRRLRVPGVFCLLYLLHPSLWYLSRNLQNDFPAGVFFLLAFYFLLLGGRALLAAGVFFALSVVVRPSGAVFIGPFLLVWFVRKLAAGKTHGRAWEACKGAWKSIRWLVVGALPFAIALVFYNVVVMHSLTGLSPGRFAEVNQACFSVGYLPRNFLLYGTVLNVSYPAMLILFFFYRGPMRWPLRASLIVGGLFYAMYFHWGVGNPLRHALFEHIVQGPRFLMVVLPLMVLAYAWVLGRLAARFKTPFWVLYVVACVLLAAGNAGITVVHQRYMDRAAYFRELLFDHTPRGSLVLMGEGTRTGISGAVTRPRKLFAAFPFDEDASDALAELDGLLSEYGEAYVSVFRSVGERSGDPDAARDRESFLGRHPHEVILDVEKLGRHLTIIRVRPPERSSAGLAT